MNKTISRSEEDTAKAAEDLAPLLLKKPWPLFMTLTGPLGAGKSVFARSLIRALTKTPNLTVPSPTFTLVQTYETEKGPIHHYDLYRLKDAEEIYEIGWEESLSDGLSIIEWPDRLGGIKPTETLDITIEHSDNEKERIIWISGA